MADAQEGEQIEIRPNKVIYSDLTKEQEMAAVVSVNASLEQVSPFASWVGFWKEE